MCEKNYNYCPRCGSKEVEKIENKDRNAFKCKACIYTIWSEPKENKEKLKC
jgi:transposase-like protein